MEVTSVTGAQVQELAKGKSVEQLVDEVYETVRTLGTLFDRIEDILRDKKELLVLGDIAVVGCIVSAGSPNAIMTMGLPGPVNLALDTLRERQGEIAKIDKEKSQ